MESGRPTVAELLAFIHRQKGRWTHTHTHTYTHEVVNSTVGI